MAATVLMLASFVTAGVAQAAKVTCAQQATIVAGDFASRTCSGPFMIVRTASKRRAQ